MKFSELLKGHSIECKSQEEVDSVLKYADIKHSSQNDGYCEYRNYLEQSLQKDMYGFYKSREPGFKLITVKEALKLLGEKEMEVVKSITQEELNKLTEINTVWGKFPVMLVSDNSEDDAKRIKRARIIIFSGTSGFIAVGSGYNDKFLCGERNFETTHWKYAVPNTHKSARMIQIEKLEKELEKLKGMEE